MFPKKLMCTVPFCLIGLLAIILLTTAAGLEVEEKEFLIGNQIRRRSEVRCISALETIRRCPEHT